MFVRKSYWSYGAMTTLAVWAVWACGPHFGLSVITARKDAFLAAPSYSFSRQLRTLVPQPIAGLAVSEFNVDQTSAEEEAITPSLRGRLATMRQAGGASGAYALGEGLPEAVRRYTTGAVAFHTRDFAAAREQFLAILALPEPARRSREIWALFMLGRAAFLAGDHRAAARRFAEVRAAAQRGLPDPLSLAVASFGEEALIHWQSRDLGPAVRLYAQQASYGSESGRGSLLEVAETILEDEKLLDRGMADPLTRRLLLAYLGARNNSGRVVRVAAALERHGRPASLEAGAVAAASYAQGNFELAERLATAQPGSAAAWVRAKLALRRGDTPAALLEYSQALAAARKDNSVHLADQALAAEFSLARLNQGEYVQALELMVETTRQDWSGPYGSYWVDAAYLAERLVTVDELKQYVDRAVPATRYAPKDEFDSPPASWQLRALLGRRLMRAGRRADAIQYFEDPKVRAAAKEYHDALARAQSTWRPQVWRAEAWWDAARLARYSGMELLGFELAPDYAAFGGNYEWPEQETLKTAAASASETQRFEATQLKRPVRFHYRTIAVEHALKAADLVPARSEGFAATLCEATHWVIHSDPATAKTVYQRYVKEGAWVPWARQFPGNCPVARLESETGWQARMALRRVSRRAGFDVIPLAGLALASAFTWGLLRWLYRPSAR